MSKFFYIIHIQENISLIGNVFIFNLFLIMPIWNYFINFIFISHIKTIISCICFYCNYFYICSKNPRDFLSLNSTYLIAFCYTFPTRFTITRIDYDILCWLVLFYLSKVHNYFPVRYRFNAFQFQIICKMPQTTNITPIKTWKCNQWCSKW